MTTKVCLGEHLSVGTDGKLNMAAWAVPRNVLDEIAPSRADTTKLLATEQLETARLLVDWKGSWLNDTPVPHMVRVQITRRYKRWVTSNPNAVEFRDRWATAIDADAAVPEVTDIHNGRCGSASDVGTNTVAEPNPGKFWHWWGTNTVDEWVGPLEPGQRLNLAYRAYVWTPPPFSNNANKNAPGHEAELGYARIAAHVFPGPSATVV
ncbi:hypothetical protein I5G59_gp31 [Mycobacterium phage LilMcDreamy]|uniref:DUF7172 domain-containing protein n=1 Tax=Mycobacterium phage LilMcDreamy TaxID=2652422 RepID=A0A5P8D7I6_9CAUD|nr:hypothetical protein I5G59_gp31 [Mycobacterium phage LilMcDreamy]QFP94651.1 hypothetical protein SEA_LILMCDREAMY_31 [Mycobacterium phage LilMcDreamy]